MKLRKRQLKNCQFYRQRIICNYIVDFYCPDAKLVIEIDGGQHYTDEGLAKDAMRDRHLADLGLTVMRVSAREVFENTEGVLEAIYRQLAQSNPPLPPFRKGGDYHLILRKLLKITTSRYHEDQKFKRY
jgi:very-short-patch-repair endonuclease